LHASAAAATLDLERLAAIRSIAGGCEIYAAGGIRDAADLSALKAAGAPRRLPDRDRPKACLEAI
jgi:deoxyribose-phosphate aldolase